MTRDFDERMREFGEHLFSRAERRGEYVVPIYGEERKAQKVVIDGFEMAVLGDPHNCLIFDTTGNFVGDVGFYSDGARDDTCIGHLKTVRSQRTKRAGSDLTSPGYAFYLDLADGKFRVSREPSTSHDIRIHGEVVERHPFEVMMEDYRALCGK